MDLEIDYANSQFLQVQNQWRRDLERWSCCLGLHSARQITDGISIRASYGCSREPEQRHSPCEDWEIFDMTWVHLVYPVCNAYGVSYAPREGCVVGIMRNCMSIRSSCMARSWFQTCRCYSSRFWKRKIAQQVVWPRLVFKPDAEFSDISRKKEWYTMQGALILLVLQTASSPPNGIL